MMGYSHRHARQFWRMLCPPALLYTEMRTAEAVLRGDPRRMLALPPAQAPVALQLAGADAAALAQAAKLGEAAGYAEINLNCGCPSPRVQNGAFGACLMKTPALVADMVAAMKDAVTVPVTVKCRIAVDGTDENAGLDEFAAVIRRAGGDALIVHARRAWLAGVNPKANRRLPPLNHARVRRLKADFPDWQIILNGGLQTAAEAAAAAATVDGVMLGRAVCRQPYLLAEAGALFFALPPPRRHDILAAMLRYIRALPPQEWRWALTALAGLYHGVADSKYYRRCLNAPPGDALRLLAAGGRWA